MPIRLRKLVDRCATSEQVWEELENNQLLYKDEILWVKVQWHRILNGYWFYQCGTPIYIHGYHYGYCSFFEIDEGLPQYRDRDRKFFLFYEYCLTDTFGFNPEFLDRKGNPIPDEEGNYRMIDLKRRVCAGFIYPKHRREGATYKAECCLLLFTITNMNCHSGIQSMDGNSAEEVFRVKLKEPWKKLPFFLRPTYSGSTDAAKRIEFKPQARKLTQDGGSLLNKDMGLQSFIDWATTAKRGFYDGAKLKFAHLDEIGKCLAYNTPVKMLDGTNKMVQDIVQGDLVMGPYGEKRTVKSLGRGEEMMYRVIPNQGEPWGCNEGHILSVYTHYGSSEKYFGVPKGSVVNMTIKRYLSLPDDVKRHLSLYKTGVNFSHKNLNIDPYTLGLWLGDGSSQEPKIYLMDDEIKEYLESRYSSTYLSADRTVFGLNIHNVRHYFRSYDLLGNKHIPNDFMFSSRDQRMELLAGIIDSDGSLNRNIKSGKPSNYEVSQKREALANQICELAMSLGFGASVKKKKTSWVYNGEKKFGVAFRVNIYGDIYTIPCRVNRKIAEKCEFSQNRRDPLKTGFKVEKVGVGKYYGFTLIEDPLFLLGDFTVTHNTTEENVDERNNVLMRCLMVGSKIQGISIHTSTVAEQSREGGENMKILCYKSHWHERNKNGETSSKLYVLFTSAADGLEGFVDKYGRSVIHDPTPEQSEQIGHSIGALEYRKNITDKLLEQGNFSQYNEELRQHPIYYKHCFIGNQQESGFNLQIINKRIDILESDGSATERGNLEWVTSRDSAYPQVEWFPDPNGKWFMSHLPSPSVKNKLIKRDGIWHPAETHRYIHSSDPFRFNKKNVKRIELDPTKKHRSKSNGGGATFWMRDISIDPPDKDIKYWQSHRFVCTYNNRVDDKITYADDMLKQTVYFGGLHYPERNMPVIWERFQEWGYGGFLKHDVDTKGQIKEEPGFYIGNNDLVKQDMFSRFMQYIQSHGMRERHVEILDECRKISGIDELKLFDLFAACAGCLIGMDNSYGEIKGIDPVNQKVDLRNYFPLHDL